MTRRAAQGGYREDLKFSPAVLISLLKEGATEKFAEGYINATERAFLQPTIHSLITRFEEIRRGVLSVSELRGHRELQLEALAVALRLLDAMRRKGGPRSYTGWECAIYACTHVIRQRRPTTNARKFYGSHLAAVGKQCVTSKYRELYRLLPLENQTLRELVDTALMCWAESGEVNEQAIETVRAHLDEVIERFRGTLRVEKPHRMDAAIVVYYISKMHGVRIPVKLILSEFGVTAPGLRFTLNRHGMDADLREARRRRKRHAHPEEHGTNG